MKKVMFLLLAALIIVSCSKKPENFTVRESNGIKYCNNTEVPNDPPAKLDLKKVFTIKTDAQTDSTERMINPGLITEDKDQNIYILDSKAHNIKKFNSIGGFQKTIGKKGQGPGELIIPVVMFINNDTLTVYSIGSSKISKFNLNGEFYYEKVINRIQFQDSKISSDGKNLVCYNMKTGLGENKDIIKWELSVIDLIEMKEKSIISSIQFSMADFMARKFHPDDNTVPFCAGNENIYLSDGTDYQYNFIGYDFEGNKKIEVKKSYNKIRLDDSEKEDYVLKKSKMMSQNKDDIKAPEFKKSIEAIYADKYGRILVIPTINRQIDKNGAYIDIFKDGKFLNRVDYNLYAKGTAGKIGEEYFSGTRMYFINREDMSIDVYDY